MIYMIIKNGLKLHHVKLTHTHTFQITQVAQTQVDIKKTLHL